MEDYLTSADPLSYTINGSEVDLEVRGKRLLPLTFELPTPELHKLQVKKINFSLICNCVLAPPEIFAYLQLDSALGNTFVVDNIQDCSMLINLMDFIFPVRPTIVVTSFNAPPHPPVAYLDPMGIIPTPIIH